MTDDELMADFLETTSYDTTGDWRETPETGASDDEPDGGMPDMPRAAKSRRSETAVHRAADKHAPAIKALFTQAFAAGAQRIPRAALGKTKSPTVAMKLLEPAIRATADVLRGQLEEILLDCLCDGGEAAVGMLRNAEEAGHEFHGNQWTAHPSEPLAKNGYLTNPLQQAGGPSPSPAWTGAKDVVEGSLAGHSFGALVAAGRQETVPLASLHSYQTWTRKDSLEHHAAGNYNGWRDRPAAIVYHHQGKDWIVDGNNRLSVLKSEGATHVQVLRIEKPSQARAAAALVQIGDHLFSRLPEDWFKDPIDA